jgi:hypothetical protein
VLSKIPRRQTSRSYPDAPAGGILHRHLHVLLAPLPGLEVEPLRLEIVGGRRLQAVEEGKKVVSGGNHRVVRIDPAGEGSTRETT